MADTKGRVVHNTFVGWEEVVRRIDDVRFLNFMRIYGWQPHYLVNDSDPVPMLGLTFSRDDEWLIGGDADNPDALIKIGAQFVMEADLVTVNSTLCFSFALAAVFLSEEIDGMIERLPV